MPPFEKGGRGGISPAILAHELHKQSPKYSEDPLKSPRLSGGGGFDCESIQWRLSRGATSGLHSLTEEL
jgi:hypothetical protein